MSLTATKFLGPAKLQLATLTDEQYLKYLHKKLPLYVSKITKDLPLDGKKDYLDIWFKQKDFIEEASKHQPLLAYELVSPKQIAFQEFSNRIQCMFGSNKSGKSGSGARKIALISQGLLESFPYKPEPNKPLYGWCCSETRALLEDAPLKQLQKWLRPDQYDLKRGNGGKIEKIVITAPNGGETHIELKPYEAGVKAFESSNIHFIWCDEPPEQRIFEAMWARLVEFSGWIMVTATTVQSDSKYLREMINGEGGLGHLRTQVAIDQIELTIWDNLTLTEQQIEEFVAMYPPGTPMHKIRVLGQYAEMEGLVFPGFMQFDIDISGKRMYINGFQPDELTPEVKARAIRIDYLDYGKDAPFTFLNAYFSQDKQGSLVDYTLWIFAEIYQAGLEARAQGQLMRRRLEEIGSKPVIWFADKQIMGDNRVAQGLKIVDYYREEMGEWFTTPRALEKDKRDPVTGLTKVGEWVNRENKVTRKPCLRISVLCNHTTKEFMNLKWKTSNELSTGKPGVTKGPNHAIDPIRYGFASGLLDNGLIYQKFGPNRPKINDDDNLFY